MLTVLGYCVTVLVDRAMETAVSYLAGAPSRLTHMLQRPEATQQTQYH
jgi:hypothetical protein